MNGAKAFFDTNVLLYMFGGADLGKQAKAKELFRRYAQSGKMMLSTQVVQEFYTTGSRELVMPRRELQEALAALMDLPLTIVGPEHILAAIRIQERHTISCWNALILAAAESGGAEVLYTEDLCDGQKYGTVLVRNPFQEPAASSSPT
jgi:predicted nucleic acid-binding protein